MTFVWILIALLPLLAIGIFVALRTEKDARRNFAANCTVEAEIVKSEFRLRSFPLPYLTHVTYTFRGQTYTASFDAAKKCGDGKTVTLHLEPEFPTNFLIAGNSIRIW
jgi:hypothetical protein